MRKNISTLACIIAAVSLVVANVVFTSCSEQVNLDEPQVVEKVRTQYVNLDVERIIDNTVVWDGEHILFNGATAMTAQVTPDSLVLTKPAAEHAAAEIIDFDNNRWLDSNGNGFSGSLRQYDLDGLTIEAKIMPADPFSTIVSIHPKVSMVKGDFRLKGFAELESGKRANFDMPVQNGTYFLSDSTTEVKTVTNTEIQIQWRDSIIVKDSIIYKDSIVYVDRVEYVDKIEYVKIAKDATVINGFGYGTINFSYGEKSFEFRMDLDSTLIHRDENGWGVAKLIGEDSNGFNLSDKQAAKYTIKENGISLKSVNFVGEAASFIKLNDIFKYGTAPVKVVIAYKNESDEEVEREFTVSGSYFHELAKAQPEPEVIVPEVVPSWTYTIEKSTKIIDRSADGSSYGEKMTVKVTRDQDGKVWKYQFMTWETGILLPTVTGTQVANTTIIRRDYRPENYTKDGWAGTFNEREGFTRVATAKAYLFDTYFPAVAGFSKTEHSAHSQIVFGTSTVIFKDAETNHTDTIYVAGTTDIKVVEDKVIFDNAAEAKVNARGLEYHYIGSHKLSVEQFVNGEKVYSQTRCEDLLAPNN